MPERKKYVRNMAAGHFRVGRYNFAPRGEYGDAIRATKEVLSNERILDMIEVGKLELTNDRTPPEDKKSPVPNVVKVDKSVNKAVILTTCLGITSDGKSCKTQATYIGGEKPPLCYDHQNQADQLEYDEVRGEWARKV